MIKLSMAALLSMSVAASAATSEIVTKVAIPKKQNQVAEMAARTKVATAQTAKTSSFNASAVSAKSAAAMGQDGNGGGGVLKNGQYMTFYSAGLYVEPTLATDSQAQIPGLNEVTVFISKLPYLSYKSKQPLLEALMPSSERTYYVASPEALTPSVKVRLLAEFERVTHVSTENLHLYALTDTTSKTTFLLPEFFKLSLADQEAILFHEAYWIVHPNVTYNQVIKAEMAFEATLKAPGDIARAFDFTNYVGSEEESYATKTQWAIQADLASGALNGLIQKDRAGYYIPLTAFLTSDVIACQAPLDNWQWDIALAPECLTIYQFNMNQLSMQFPKSALLSNLKKSISIQGNSGSGRRIARSFYNNSVRESGRTLLPLNWMKNNDYASTCKIYLNTEEKNIICSKGIQGNFKFGWPKSEDTEYN